MNRRRFFGAVFALPAAPLAAIAAPKAEPPLYVLDDVREPRIEQVAAFSEKIDAMAVHGDSVWVATGRTLHEVKMDDFRTYRRVGRLA